MPLVKKITKNLCYHTNRALVYGRSKAFEMIKFSLHKPIFIIGCSRSGTTAVYKTFSESSHLASLHKESHEMWDMLHPPSAKDWQSHALTAADAAPSDMEVVTRFFYSRLGRKQMVDKANQNCFRIPYLLKLFPDAVFVWVKRSGPDNINSLLHGWNRPDEYGAWSKDLPAKIRIDGGKYTRWCFFLFPGWEKMTHAAIEEVCTAQWIAANQTVLDAKSRVPDPQWVEIFYEDILTDAVGTFHQAFEKLHIPFDQKMNTFCSNLVQHPFNAFSTPRQDKWKQENPEKITRILPALTDMMTKMGYDG